MTLRTSYKVNSWDFIGSPRVSLSTVPNIPNEFFNWTSHWPPAAVVQLIITRAVLCLKPSASIPYGIKAAFYFFGYRAHKIYMLGRDFNPLVNKDAGRGINRRWVQDSRTYSPRHSWCAITSDSGFMRASCSPQSELRPVLMGLAPD